MTSVMTNDETYKKKKMENFAENPQRLKII
jgi:hypothetical protein